MKQFFCAIIGFLTSISAALATETNWYYTYHQTNYIQSTWVRSNLIEPSMVYLHAQLNEDNISLSYLPDFVEKALKKLKEVNSPRYQGLKIQVAEHETNQVLNLKFNKFPTEYEAIKNELVATFCINGYTSVELVTPKGLKRYTLKDVTVPYLDLRTPKGEFETFTIPVRDTIVVRDTITQTVAATKAATAKPKNTALYFSVGLNLLLIAALIFLYYRGR
jgi:hypothetical protein